MAELLNILLFLSLHKFTMLLRCLLWWSFLILCQISSLEFVYICSPTQVAHLVQTWEEKGYVTSGWFMSSPLLLHRVQMLSPCHLHLCRFFQVKMTFFSTNHKKILNFNRSFDVHISLQLARRLPSQSVGYNLNEQRNCINIPSPWCFVPLLVSRWDNYKCWM